MVLESKNKGNVLTLSFNDEKTKNSISANDWIEFRKQVKEFDESELRNVDVGITRLRQKIEKTPKQPQYIKTIRGKGYMLICKEI